MIEICLIRHGETDWNSLGKLQGRTDIPLNKNGINQARECGKFLASANWDLIVTSPLQRAKQTAEIIRSLIDIPIFEMADFLERDYGDAEGMTVKERTAAFPDKKYPNQENRNSLNKRVVIGLEKIIQSYKCRKVILVAHGAVINAILAELSNGEVGSGKTRLMNACISNIIFSQDTWNIRNFNQVAHLSQYSEEDKN
ncbi:histidine phosphatase family protein (plasmid) [Cytobacillus oceanisediminis]|uniref:histidine phosphatase family protein n=1 Tax=Cytobacillus oceanisediminis TaxID=665099 RepID=UPI001863A59C|nr:histidine phosphatase family protein [Cytobacillus oceanisediminis]QOK30108.1 histidine phosphatase family protein [Cytobacillus oceanisediminis]